MKGNFSRVTFDKTEHFSQVLMQQGRVQLDADWNEQATILLHYLRTLAADLIGPFAGPAGKDWGFEVKSSDQNDLSIGQGRYYVDGILCENHQQVSYKKQRDYPGPLDLDNSKSYLAYLDVWERHITALENDNIREKALGGPDTASRAKVVWQVRIEEVADDPTPSVAEIHKNWHDWIARWQPPHLGCLKARVKRPEDSNDPCLTAPDAKYRGAENQLYRVEIHRPGRSATQEELGAWQKGQSPLPLKVATFKWSRDNGAIVTGCELKGTNLTLHSPRGFAANQWVELANDGQELRGEPGTLVKITKVEGDVLTLESTPSPSVPMPQGETWPTKARRWDQSEKGGLKFLGGAVPVKENDSNWIELEDGVQIQFLPPTNEKQSNHYRTGDYWLIPARVATGNVEWPVKLDMAGNPVLEDGNMIPIPKPPQGIRHHYAPLAILIRANDSGWTLEDCRCDFTAMNSCKIGSHGEDGMGSAPSCDSSG